MQNDTSTQRTQTSRDRAIERATHRALEQVAQGNHPVLLREHVHP